MRYFCFCRILFYLFIYMYISCFKIFHNYFIYLPILFKNNRVLALTNTKPQSSPIQSNVCFFSYCAYKKREGRTDGQTDIFSCSEFDNKHNDMKIFSLLAISTVLEKCRLNAIYSSAFLRRV